MRLPHMEGLDVEPTEHTRSDVTVESFEGFYGQAWRLVHRAVTVAIGDHDLAREAVDEAMTRAYERWKQVSTMTNKEGWVYRVAVNWARSQLRRRAVAARSTPGIPDHYYQNWPDPELGAAVSRLPAKQRDVVIARYVLDLSEQGTSTAFGVPEGTVKSRLNRALDNLRKDLT